MIVVALLYNTNGMATWCLEAAHALHDAGQEVLLIIDEEQRPDLKETVFPFRTFLWSFEKPERNKTLAGKLKAVYRWTFSGESSGFTYLIHQKLNEIGINPSLYLLNQSDLQDERCKVPQYVVAWAYPATLSGYLGKTLKQSPLLFNMRTVHSLLGAVSWYKKDWRAYKSATGVLAVSNRLAHYFQNSTIKAHLLYPPLNVKTAEPNNLENEKVKILFAAVNLENPQKHIEWGVNALRNFRLKDKIEINFVGQYTYLKDVAESTGVKSVFHGLLPRAELINVMRKCDVFIFCSSFDDWGYVQVEAMAEGMIVIAPEISPSDEIINNEKLLYKPGNSESLLKCLENIVSSDNLDHYKSYCRKQSFTFGQTAFTTRLNKIV